MCEYVYIIICTGGSVGEQWAPARNQKIVWRCVVDVGRRRGENARMRWATVQE